jgi:membrane protease YdiL (CAAX protease family)
MIINKKYVLILEATLCSLGFMVFAYFIHDGFPKLTIALVALMVQAFIMSRQCDTLSDLKKYFGEISLSKRALLFIFIGILMGFTYAAYYRHAIGMPVIPDYVRSFALVAALIGIMEELVFRGFIQGHLKSVNTVFSILFGTIAHTAYKSCLFMSPVIAHKINIHFLIWWTLIGGLLFGILKEYSKSIIPPAIAHSLFDIITYAGCAAAPWWVW